MMSNSVAPLTHARLCEVLVYNSQTGVFIWRERPARTVHQKIWNARFAKTRAGSFDKDGYVTITIDGLPIPGHRLAWFYVHGEWPENEIDHRDTIPDHNWLDNLRPASSHQNKWNVGRRKDNISGAKGVRQTKSGKWVARIRFLGKLHHLGTFEKFEDARQRYATAASQYFGEFARIE